MQALFFQSDKMNGVDRDHFGKRPNGGGDPPQRRWFGVLSVVFAVHAMPAQAEFAICNQSFDVVNVAVGQDNGGVFQTEGWWTIGTNQCANVVKDVLRSRYIYVFAQDVFGQPLLNGVTEMCVAEERFVIDGINDCWQRGFIAAPFLEVDTKSVERWTLFLTPRE